MRVIMFLACFMLAGCGVAMPAATPPPPSALAEQTTLDEQGALGVELAYKAARIAVEFGVDNNFIRGEAATKFRTLNAKAYRATLASQAAYRAGNAQGYDSALKEARAAIAELLSLTGKDSP